MTSTASTTGTYDIPLGSFDHYTRLVQRLLHVPLALVSLVEPRRQVFPGASGLPASLWPHRETPLSHSFCQYVVLDEKPLVIEDAREDYRLHDNPAIRDLGVVAYAGWPLVDHTGRTIGSLCAIDSVPRVWTDDDLATLEDLATACSAQLQGSLRHARASETVARTIFESVEVALAFYDNDGHLILANRLAEELATMAGFRIDQPPYAGDRVRRSDNRTPIPAEMQVIPRGLRGAPDHHEMEWIGVPGNQRAVVTSSRRVAYADGPSWGTLFAAHDVTPLARAVEVREQFIATVSHELWTPLTSVLLYQEALADELQPATGFVADSLEAIRRGAMRLQERITELLQTADHDEHDHDDLTLVRTDLSSLARLVSATVGEQTKALGLDLAVEADEPQWAVVDVRRIEQALENVVSNALKYTGAGGRVLVAVGGDAEQVEVVVSDDGVGMSVDEVAQAFDSFWRSEGARDHAVQGIGIGLTLVRAIVEQHGGTVDIASRPGCGTVVTMSVPRRPAGRDREPAHPSYDARRPGS